MIINSKRNAKHVINLKFTEKKQNFSTLIFRNNFSENTGIKLHFNICFTIRD
jgi:hypothetical protein